MEQQHAHSLFPKALLLAVVQYTVSPYLQLVLSSKCKHLLERCHFGSKRRVGISLDTDICHILYAFLHLDEREFALTATDAQGKLHDFSVLSRLPARDLPLSSASCDREIRLRVQAKCKYYHECASCEETFRCIPKGYPRPTKDLPLPDLSLGCECHRLSAEEGLEWYCSNDCYYD